MWLVAMHAILARPGSTTVEASEITPWLLIGGKPAAQDAMNHNSQAITHVLNCAEPWCAQGPNDANLEYMGIEAYDEPGYAILKAHYESVKPILDEARRGGGRCLVHCSMGVNRSCCIAVAFLIDACGMSLLEACALVKDHRGAVLGNQTFRCQLLDFAAEREQLGSREFRDEWIAKAPVPEPPAIDTTVPPPPEEWIEAAVPARVGAKCRVQLYGEWRTATITKVEEMGPGENNFVTCIYDHDGTEDSLREGEGDLYCEPC